MSSVVRKRLRAKCGGPGGKPGPCPSPSIIQSKLETLGLRRNELPQIAGKDKPEFLSSLENHGIKWSREDIPAGKLRGAQADYNKDKVQSMVDQLRRGEKLPVSPVMVSNDGYVADGHHRWRAQVEVNPKGTLSSYRVDLPIRDLLDEIRKFPKSFMVGTEVWAV